LAAGSPDANRRGGPDDGRRVPQGRRLLPWRRQPTRRAEGRGRPRLRAHSRAGAAVRGHRSRGPRVETTFGAFHPARARPIGPAMPHDVVTFGEAMIRLAPPNFRRLEQARSLDVQVGGAELNTAVALARLGRKTAWVSRLTDNPLGRLVANHAREAG